MVCDVWRCVINVCECGGMCCVCMWRCMSCCSLQMLVCISANLTLVYAIGAYTTLRRRNVQSLLVHTHTHVHSSRTADNRYHLEFHHADTNMHTVDCMLPAHTGQHRHIQELEALNGRPDVPHCMVSVPHIEEGQGVCYAHTVHGSFLRVSLSLKLFN